MNYQSKISAELQKWYDEGWQPVGEVGPSSIKIQQYTQWDGAAAVIWTIATAGLALIIAPFLRESFTEPTEFRLQMRAPKGTKSPVELPNTPSQLPRSQKEIKQINDPAQIERQRVEKLGIEVAVCPNCQTINSLSLLKCEKCNTNLKKVKPIRNPYI